MIPFKNRFHGHNSVSYVYKHGHIERSRFATLKTTKNPKRKESRLTVVISKKILKSAVKRNRVRRRVYEYLRTQIPNITGAHDIVIIITSPEILISSHQEVTDSIGKMLCSAGLIKSF